MNGKKKKNKEKKVKKKSKKILKSVFLKILVIGHI